MADISKEQVVDYLSNLKRQRIRKKLVKSQRQRA